MDSLESALSLETSNNQNDALSSSSSVLLWHELMAGGIAGSAGVIVGHPFDSYKVRLQTTAISATSTSATGHIVPTSRTVSSSLFRGLGPPVAAAALVNATIFVTYGESSRLYKQFLLRETVVIPADSGDTWRPLLCGGFTGLVSSALLTPTEHIKCRLQVASSGNFKHGPVHAVRHIVNMHGIAALYRGFCATCLRQTPSFAIYFGTYESIKERVIAMCRQRNLIANNDDSLLASALAGSVSGSLAWAAVYPADTIKTHIQTQALDSPKKTLRIRQVAKMLYNAQAGGGFKALYRGIGITVLRAFPVNGIIFPVYEYSLRNLSNTNNTTWTVAAPPAAKLKTDSSSSDDVPAVTATLNSFPTLQDRYRKHAK